MTNHLYYRKVLPFNIGDTIEYANLNVTGKVIGFGQGNSGAVTCKVLLDGSELISIPCHKYKDINVLIKAGNDE
jgi:hypothetical protein